MGQVFREIAIQQTTTTSQENRDTLETADHPATQTTMPFLSTNLGRKLRALFCGPPAGAESKTSTKLCERCEAEVVGRRAHGKPRESRGVSDLSDGIDGAHSDDSNLGLVKATSPESASQTAAIQTDPISTSIPSHDEPTMDLEVDLDNEEGACEGDDDFLDEPTEWTPEQLQEVRESNYQTFCGEDETDYTKGPSRVVLATDGVEDCTALLLTLDLSKAVRKAVKAQRAYKKTRTAATDKIAALNRFKHTINAEIRSHKSRIAALKDVDAADQAKALALKEELSNLELMLEEYNLERTAIENNLTWRGDQLRAVQSQLSALLEDSWINALLLEPEEDVPQHPTPDYDLQAEYAAFCNKLRDSATSPLAEAAAPTLDTSKAHLRAALPPAAQAQIQESERLHTAVWDAWDRVDAAQTAFDARDAARDAAAHARLATLARAARPDDATSEAFDLRWHLHERALTRELIDAEAAYTAALEAQVAFAGTSAHGAASDDDVGDDGYSLSSEADAAALAPVGRIAAWLAGMPEVPAMPEPDEPDGREAGEAGEWEADELGWGDDMQAVVEREEARRHEPLREMIDGWQRTQAELAAGFAWMKS